MFAGVAADNEEMLREITDGNAQTTAVVTQAQQTATSMQAKQQDAMSAVAKIPAAIGGWGVVWLAGVYYFVLRPLLK
jgi:hypothetical protein